MDDCFCNLIIIIIMFDFCFYSILLWKKGSIHIFVKRQPANELSVLI